MGLTCPDCHDAISCPLRQVGSWRFIFSKSAQVKGRAVIFIYDGYEGGIGLSERAYNVYEALPVAEKMVRECRCKDGCPACIYSPKCGNDNQPLDKKGCIALLKHISG